MRIIEIGSGLMLGLLLAATVMALIWARLTGHRHNWRCVWHLGDVWTECQVCGERWLVPPDDLSEMPPDYPIADRFTFARPTDELFKERW